MPVVSLLCAATLVSATGCGDSDDDAAGVEGTGATDGAQPIPHSSSFREGLFDELPRYPGATEVSERDAAAGVIVQSFQVKTADAEQIVSYYVQSLSDWTLVDREELGRFSERADFEMGVHHLTLSASRAPALAESEPGDTFTTQYSLTLGEAQTSTAATSADGAT